MKALCKIKPGKEGVKLVDIDEPYPKDNEIKIKIYAAGICGTDMHIFKDEYESNYPVIMGHEYSGTVVEVGKEVDDFIEGDRVVSLTAAKYCGKCDYCYNGLTMLCSQRKSIGSGVNGAFAEYMVVPSHLAFKIPENISLKEATLSEPLACVVRSVIEISKVKAGDYVYVSGPGTIGQITVQVASACGARVIISGTDKDIKRLELAKSLGAYETINVDSDDIEKKVMGITKGYGVDVAFECAGVKASARTCLEILKKTGQYVQVGLFGKTVEFDHDLALKKEIGIVNSFASEKSSWKKALRLLEFGMINANALVSDEIPIKNWEKGFEKAFKKEGNKILLKP